MPGAISGPQQPPRRRRWAAPADARLPSAPARRATTRADSPRVSSRLPPSSIRSSPHSASSARESMPPISSGRCDTCRAKGACRRRSQSRERRTLPPPTRRLAGRRQPPPSRARVRRAHAPAGRGGGARMTSRRRQPRG
eukprot:scaffold3112_cov136-Isochrysis_galbana.AAC.1